jgi:hypothetical protein
MDVALDSNAYLADPRMDSVAFRSLLDYLRKTESNLIIPKIVLDEVIARYPERLSPHVKRTISEASSLRNLVLVSKIAKIEVDTTAELRALRKKLTKPSAHVKSVILRNFGDISPADVARRGIERTAPANSSGEQLRDVMVWLMIVGYARSTSREIAFITADKHFRHEENLHPHLAQEILAGNLSLRFYIAIDDFIKAHAPRPHQLTSHEAFDLYGKSHVLDRFEIAVRRSYPGIWHSAASVEVIGRKVDFIRGALYEVGPDSKYGEMEFSVELNLRVTNATQSFTVPTDALTATYKFKPLSGFVPFAPDQIFVNPPVFTPAYVPQQQWIPSTSQGVSSPFEDLAKTVNRFIVLGDAGGIGELRDRPQDYTVNGRIVISCRLVSGTVKQLETEKIESVNLSRIT